MQLKRFEPADRPTFLAMCQDFYGGGAAAVHIPVSQMEAAFDVILSGTPYAFGYLFDVEGVPAGYALGYPFYSNEAGCFCLMLEEIYVAPAYRSRRLGTEYLQTVARVVSEELSLPIGGLKLEVCPSNPRARQLYEAMGFTALPYTAMVKHL